ncbi:trichodiene oxygenase [Pseudovirgaria hyperparasitica]|uniref:Trichodiene oxygenase n=1 Tax=Pseudovirgaria hyperparasitica TaxID=470096 RepID=A0A6A6W9G1_9PEZI|nr:trichodiene oxygenase [Pseudovirgaria hyperparasitica]KAF2757731.1 trichodiene oxygenase [Pseudovirgaria hyperparasitica]
MVEISLTPVVCATSLLLVWAAYVAYMIVWRLYYHPLSKFPGHKIVAVSRWYEAYYEIVRKGTYYEKIQEFHDQYGPVVRVGPDELHVRDSLFYDELYAKNQRVIRPGWENRFGNPGAMIATPSHVIHRQRRAVLNPLFSRRSILEFQGIVQQHVRHLVERIHEYRRAGKPVTLSDGFCAVTGDIIMDYAFGFNYNHVGKDNFESFREALMTSGDMGHIGTFFPTFFSLAFSLPAPVIEMMESKMSSLLLFRRNLSDLLDRVIRGNHPHEKRYERTVFQEILNSDLPPEEKTKARLTDEAFGIVGAGVTTVAFTLMVGAFHIINNAAIHRTLKQELKSALPGDDIVPDLLELEKIPYLKACIQEAVRLSYGITARNPRQHDRPMHLHGWTIPAFTTISMTTIDVHHDENIFPDSFKFIPERWLNSPRAPDGEALDHYLVSWGKGPRACIGINLAWAELFLTMGSIFRSFDFEMFETDASDVTFKHDFFIPESKLDSNGLRVRVG